MSILLPIAGGKGGVGKSILSLNISIELAKKCKSVILVDLDMGGANLHTLLGLKNNQAGIGSFIVKKTNDFSDLLQATGIPNLQFIAGDCLFPGVANMDFFTKKKISKELMSLNADYIVLDLGAGSTHNIVDFFLTSYNGIIVATPELTSILNAYSFIKSAIFRFCYRQYKNKSPERTILKNSILQRLEGRDYSFYQILDVIEKTIPGSGTRVLRELSKMNPRLILNMTHKESDAEMAFRLQSLVKKKLSINLGMCGFMPYDEQVSPSIARRRPLALINKDSSLITSLQPVIQRITSDSFQKPELEDAQETLDEIVSEFYLRNQSTSE